MMFGRRSEVQTPESKVEAWKPKYRYIVEGTVYSKRHNWYPGAFTRTVEVIATSYDEAADKSGLDPYHIKSVHRARYIR